MRVDFAVNPKAAVGLLEEIADRGADMRPAMTVIRELLIAGHQQNFESQGRFLGEPWPALAESTRARKSRQGLPAGPMVASGSLLEALSGGSGKATRVTRTSAAVGVSRRLFYIIFHLAGATRGRRGKLPARPVLGIGESEHQAAVTIMQNYLEHGVT